MIEEFAEELDELVALRLAQGAPVAAQDAHGDFRVVEEIIHHRPDPGLSFLGERFERRVLQDSRHFLGGGPEGFRRGDRAGRGREESDDGEESEGQSPLPPHIP